MLDGIGRTVVASAALVAAVLACGGASTSDGGGNGGTAGTGGTSGSSSSSTTGSGASASTGTSSGSTGTGGSVCCAAAAVCDPGDLTIDSLDACPEGGDCYSSEICCSRVWCVRQAAQCDAIPTCDAGDRELTGECPPANTCYTRSLCGSTIWCLPGGGDAGAPGAGGASCDPDSEYNRDYIGESPEICATIRYACPAETLSFSNDCGCGCEQSADCPAVVDCEPGPNNPDPLCVDQDPDPCPYTGRAL